MVKKTSIPKDGLLNAYAEQDNAYTDCFYTDIPQSVSITDLIAAFFTTPVFRLERAILALTGAASSTHQDVEDLAAGKSEKLAVWRVEKRESNQLLLTVSKGRVRTWLMTEPLTISEPGYTRLFFGSAVIAKKHKPGEKPEMGILFHALLGFHKIYSRILLWSAKAQINKQYC